MDRHNRRKAHLQLLENNGKCCKETETETESKTQTETEYGYIYIYIYIYVCVYNNMFASYYHEHYR